MALNYIWIGFFLIGILVGILKLVLWGDTEALPAMMDSTFSMAKDAFEMSLGLTGTLALWMGLMKTAEDSGLVQKMAKALSPVLTCLFPDLPKNHPALGSIFMNISANMLGLDNAATPTGLKAMQQLQELNPQKDTATNAMIMLLTLNTSGLTLIPVSILAYRSQAGAVDPADVFIPILLATLASTLVGLLVVSVYQRINLFRKAIVGMFAAIALLVAALFTAIHGMDTEDIQLFCRVLTSVILLGIITIFLLFGVVKKLDVYGSFVEGAKQGFQVAVGLIPFLVAILVAIGVFRASGALLLVQDGLTWAVGACGLDTDFVNAIPVALMKPISGSGARGMMLEIFNNPAYGPDSFIGHLASVFQGSTDTTLYILAVYFGSVGIKKYRHALACGLLADLAGMLAAIFICYFFFG